MGVYRKDIKSWSQIRDEDGERWRKLSEVLQFSSEM